jgi:uncharacterized protein with ParB-like and HNH nuclease domain/predicted transport protein
MRAAEAKLLDFLKKSSQFVIPIYQRTYSWGEKECLQLWDDINRCGQCDHIPVHFIGSIVYVESGLSQVTHQAPLLVIDGQQRLTTVSLLLSALAESIGEKEPFDGFTQRKIRNYYLLNPEEVGDKNFKLMLSQTDKETLKSVVKEQVLPKNHSIRILENLTYFKKLIRSGKVDLAILCKGLAKLVVVDIALSREQDNPQLIFESMNSTGKELSQADLIRNYILMGLEPKLQTHLYEQYWRPMETDFGQEAYGIHFDAFMRHFLTVKTGEIPKINAVYDAFKTYTRETRTMTESDDNHIEKIVSTIRMYSRYFCAMALGKETDLQLKKVFRDLRELKVDVAYPFLLELYHDFSNEILSKEDLVKAVRWVESYVFRRAVCSIPTNSMNKTFATFNKNLKKDRYLESIAAYFLLLPSYRRFPNDEEFERDIKTRDLYNFRNRSFWLRRFENFGRKELVPVDEYTIEHIMPQNEKLSDEWKKSLGTNWEHIQQTWLHTLGNLTLTGYNSEYSDRPFIEKRDMLGGFKYSPLKVNQNLGKINIWDESAIIERANQLSKQAVEVWNSPKLDNSILEAYNPKNTIQAVYSIDDHPYLTNPTISILFEAFRKEVLALDLCVTEEFLKLYVAYKAETNFVDVVPQAKRLRISLNMRFAELSDPKGICKDVSNLGRWGNGEVEFGFSSIDELPYVIGLVRQSIEKQLGEAATYE